MLKLCICGTSGFREKIINITSDYFDKNDTCYSFSMYSHFEEIPFDKYEFDIVFIDVQFNDNNNKNVKILYAEEIFSKYPDMKVILVIDFFKHIFRTRSMAFLPKCELENEFIPTLELLINTSQNNGNYHIFSFNGKALKIYLKDIMYIESIKHDIYIHLADNKTEKVSSTLETIEKNLSRFGFVRIHIGYIVNKDAVFSVDSKNITLKDGTLLPVSRRRINYVKDKFSKFLK